MSYVPRVRTRITPTKKSVLALSKIGQVFIENGFGSDIWIPYGAPKTWFGESTWTKYERTVDELHGKPPYRVGGPFENIKISRPFAEANCAGIGTYYSEVPFTALGYTGRIKYQGGFAPPPLSSMGIAGLDLSDSAAMNALVPSIVTLGSTVWDRLKPKIEQGGLFVAIAEVKDIPRMLQTSAGFFKHAWETSLRVSNTARYRDVYYPLRQTKVMKPKELADQFINFQFGWAPFVKDIEDLCANILFFTERMARLAKENGQWVRRRATLVGVRDESGNTHPRVETRTINSGEGCLLYPGSVIGGSDWTLFYSPSQAYVPPHWEILEETSTISTAVGQFRYWLPEFAGPNDNPYLDKLAAVQRTLTLLGLRASPSNIYKAIPWSWLVDWVSGVGRSIQALQDQTLDDMIAKYISLVHHKVTTRIFRQYMPFNSSSGGPRFFDFTQITDVKQRKMNTSPFGFYLDASELNPRQLAILGALGISRRKWVRTR
jgi:hypothetical protein